MTKETLSSHHLVISYQGFNVVSFLLHGVNAILTVIDVGVSASPYRLAHVYQPLILALVYSIWTIIHAYARIDNGHLVDSINKSVP